MYFEYTCPQLLEIYNCNMEFIEFFKQINTATTLLFISLTGISGILIGKIKIFNIKLGIAGVLFAGLVFGHFGARGNHEVIHLLKEFGLILFVYSIGLEVGPRFISSLKNNGIKINLLAAGIVVLGVLIAAAFKVGLNLPIPVITGILCGAVTNTPSLGAAQQVITEQLSSGSDLSEITGMGYAVAYPFGIIGIIITMILIRAFFRISIKDESAKYQKEVSGLSGKPIAVNLRIKNQALFEKPISFTKASLKGEFVLSRLLRDNKFIIPNENEIILKNDTLYGVTTIDNFKNLELKVGPLKKTEDIEISNNISIKHVVITNKKLAGQTISQIGLSRNYPVNITRIFRAGIEIMATEENSVEFGDTVRIIGERKEIKRAAAYLGNSMKDLSHPNIIPILIGILAGILIGSIPFSIPGLPAPAKLGLAGGPLLVALFLGHKGRIGKLDFYMTPGANLFIRELGIVLFLACVGLSSGQHFVQTIIDGGYMWMLYGIAITLVPLLVVGFIARILKFNYLSICGLLAGSMTDPPALEFANSLTPGQAQATAYATVYPLVMFLRVLLAQVLVLSFM